MGTAHPHQQSELHAFELSVMQFIPCDAATRDESVPCRNDFQICLDPELIETAATFRRGAALDGEVLRTAIASGIFSFTPGMPRGHKHEWSHGLVGFMVVCVTATYHQGRVIAANT